MFVSQAAMPGSYNPFCVHTVFLGPFSDGEGGSQPCSFYSLSSSLAGLARRGVGATFLSQFCQMFVFPQLRCKIWFWEIGSGGEIWVKVMPARYPAPGEVLDLGEKGQRFFFFFFNSVDS